MPGGSAPSLPAPPTRAVPPAPSSGHSRGRLLRWESRRGRGAGPTRSLSRPAAASALLGPPPRRRPPGAGIRRRRSSGDPPASLPISTAGGGGSSSAGRLPLPFCSGSIRRGDSSQSGHCACAQVFSSPCLSSLRVRGGGPSETAQSDSIRLCGDRQTSQ